MLAGPTSALSRIWEANLARPEEFLGQGFRLTAPGDPESLGGAYDAAGAEETSMLPSPPGDWRALYSASLGWNGLLRREGAVFGEIASGRADQAAWIRPLPLLDLALTWSRALERNRYTEPNKMDAHLGGTRDARGLAIAYHLLPPSEDRNGAGFLNLVDFALSIPDVDRQGFVWSLAAGGRRWRAEYSLEQGDIDEPFAVTNLDSGGNGERVPGVYRVRTLSHRILGTLPLGSGSLTLLGIYANGVPRHPGSDQEYWFSDSSRSAEASARYGRSFAWGEGFFRAAYGESEVLTYGRRIPPGSEGLKRFHYARNHAETWGASLGRDPLAGASRLTAATPADARTGLYLGAGYRDYAWTSRPFPGSLEARNETLSYNRLGLSFLANLYGGLLKESEIISGSLHAGSWEVHGDWSAGARAWSGSAGLSAYRTDFRLQYDGHSLSQRLFSIDTSAGYGGSPSGHLIGVTPRLGAAWSRGRFRAEIAASQVVPLVVAIDGPDGSSASQGGSDGSPASYPWFRNGFAAQAGIQAGY